MAWNDALLPASFRGIPFFVDSHEKTGGRNAVSHEPPERDSSFAEDMGKRADGYRIRGHVLGDTYFFIRDALINAMETKQAGILIHPYLGLIDVQPNSYTFSEDTQEGRIARFDLQFVEAGKPNVIFDAIDTATTFVTTQVALVAQIENAFALAVSFSGLPGYVADSALAIHFGAIATFEAAKDKINANVEALAVYNKKVEDFEETGPPQLLSDQSGYVSQLGEVMESLGTVPEDSFETQAADETIQTKKDRSDEVAVFDPIFTYTSEQADVFAETAPEELTATRLAERKNNEALVQAMRQLAIVHSSAAAANQSYFSIEAAVDQRNVLNDLIDEQLNITGLDDNLFQALIDQKASNVAMIPDPRRETGTRKDIILLETTPSLVLVYEEYGDVDRETDVLDRNRIQNPAFVDGTIEVIRFG